MVELHTKVRWGELDALGHVNNSVYFRWFEDVRIALFEQVGIVSDGPTTLGPILATTTCDFHRPLAYPCDITVQATIPRVGNTSFGMDYQVLTTVDGVEVLAAKGSAVVVLVNHQTGKKQPVSDRMRVALGKHQ